MMSVKHDSIVIFPTYFRMYPMPYTGLLVTNTEQTGNVSQPSFNLTFDGIGTTDQRDLNFIPVPLRTSLVLLISVAIVLRYI